LLFLKASAYSSGSKMKKKKKKNPLLKEICNTESSPSEPKNKNERVQWLFVRMSEESVAWKF